MSKNYRISKSDIGHYVAVPLNREGMIRPRPDHHIVVHGKLVDIDKDTV